MEMGEGGQGRMEVGESSRRGKKRRENKSVRAGVIFPVGRIRRYLKNGRYAKQVRWPAAVFMSAAIEYVVGEVLESSARAAQALKKKTIIPRHIVLAVKGSKYEKDEEDEGRDEKNQMLKLFSKAIIPQGGVMPLVNPLLPKEKPKESSKNSPPKSPQNTSNQSPENTDENSSKKSPPKSPKNSSKQSPENTDENSSKNCSQKLSEDSSEQLPENTDENSPENRGENSMEEESLEEWPENMDEEDSLENFAEDSFQNLSENSSEESPQASSESSL